MILFAIISKLYLKLHAFILLDGQLFNSQSRIACISIMLVNIIEYSIKLTLRLKKICCYFYYSIITIKSEYVYLIIIIH